MGNLFTIVAMWGWLPLSMALFAFLRPQTAFLVSFYGGTMFLPEKYEVLKLPGIPAFQKSRWLALITLLGLAFFHRRVFSRMRFGPLEALTVLVCIFGAFTAWTNLDPLAQGMERVDGHTVYDAVNITIEYVLTFGVPMIVAKLLFRTSDDLRLLIKGLAALATIYAVFFLYEVRMSPVLHLQVYGYMQHDFSQTVRGDGYRPMAFMAHGLAVAAMNAASFLAAIVAWRSGLRMGKYSALWFGLLAGGLLAIGRSFGALMFGIVGGIAVSFLRPARQAAIAAVLGALVITYPQLRMADLIPTDDLVAWIQENVSEQRAGSLNFRFVNELILAERANERMWFGWGLYCRPCVRDPETGRRSSVADGEWVITYGSRGLLGFLAFFGALVLPLFTTWWKLGMVPDPDDRKLLAGLSLIVALNLVDLIPNSLFAPALTLSIVGALYAFSQTLPDPDLASENDQPFARFASLIGRMRAASD